MSPVGDVLGRMLPEKAAGMILVSPLSLSLWAKVGASYYTYPLLILMINEINLPLSGEVPRRGGGGKKEQTLPLADCCRERQPG